MKRKLYGEEEDDNGKFNGIFSKLRQQPPLLHLTTSSAAVEFLPVSEREEEQEEDSSSHIYNSAVRKISQVGHLHPPPHDGATIELGRRPRGRPPGSRNKTKPPSIISSKALSEPSMSPYILELPPGIDVIEATTHFCRKRKLCLCILTGSGTISNFTIKQPSTTPGAAAITFHGRFDILSISATILDQSGIGVPGNGQFIVHVAAGPQGQLVGGVVVGPMVAATTIYLVAGTFSGHSFCRLQPDGDDETSMNGGGEDRHEYRPAASGEAAEHCPDWVPL
ncbi:AT-hook motif nuclear-localized protein 28-like [Primulina eburnea]|uniref:AT-hook motif nuclear-localized protein 28-like n=1 Tax=Primulina eburnea TaxID=1245227 RepID=UPI003C6BDB98